jgi:ADP-heptose:LPS heptosyltransferase
MAAFRIIDNKPYYMKRKTFRIIALGGLGDMLLSTPVFSALKREYPNCKIIVLCWKGWGREIYIHNPNIDKIRPNSLFANPRDYIAYYLKLAKFDVLNYGAFHPGLTYEINATQIIGDMFGVKHCGSKVEVYLTGKEEEWGRRTMAEFRNPIVIHITSASSKNQNWPRQNWEELIRSLPEYTFIQIGSSFEEKVEGAVDLRGKTSFREGLSILRSSISFVGVVSSFSHATSAFGIPGVVLFGASTPKVWGHPNNINLYKNLRCAPCFDLLLDSTCPYGSPCMSGITVEEVRNALLSQVNGLKN